MPRLFTTDGACVRRRVCYFGDRHTGRHGHGRRAPRDKKCAADSEVAAHFVIRESLFRREAYIFRGLRMMVTTSLPPKKVEPTETPTN